MNLDSFKFQDYSPLMQSIIKGFFALYAICFLYMTRFAYKLRPEANGQVCYQYSQAEIYLIRLISIIMWLGFIAKLYIIIKLRSSCTDTDSSFILGCGGVFRIIVAILLILSEIGTLGTFSAIAFKLKPQNTEIACTSFDISSMEHRNMSVFWLWITNLALLSIVLGLIK